MFKSWSVSWSHVWIAQIGKWTHYNLTGAKKSPGRIGNGAGVI